MLKEGDLHAARLVFFNLRKRFTRYVIYFMPNGIHDPSLHEMGKAFSVMQLSENWNGRFDRMHLVTLLVMDCRIAGMYIKKSLV